MKRKAQIEDVNPVYVGLAVLGGMIAWFVASRAVEGAFVPILSGLLSVVATYFYLALTER